MLDKCGAMFSHLVLDGYRRLEPTHWPWRYLASFLPNFFLIISNLQKYCNSLRNLRYTSPGFSRCHPFALTLASFVFSLCTEFIADIMTIYPHIFQPVSQDRECSSIIKNALLCNQINIQKCNCWHNITQYVVWNEIYISPIMSF